MNLEIVGPDKKIKPPPETLGGGYFYNHPPVFRPEGAIIRPGTEAHRAEGPLPAPRNPPLSATSKSHIKATAGQSPS
jgi:hypothetical protein